MPEATPSAMVTSCSPDRKSTRLNSSHVAIWYAVFCLQNKQPAHSVTMLSGGCFDVALGFADRVVARRPVLTVICPGPALYRASLLPLLPPVPLCFSIC